MVTYYYRIHSRHGVLHQNELPLLHLTHSSFFRTLSKPDVVRFISLPSSNELDCSSRIVLSVVTKKFTKSTVIVLAEDVVTKEVLRCDVIVDTISSLSIFTKTKRLFVEDSPEIFQVRAYNEEGTHRLCLSLTTS